LDFLTAILAVFKAGGAYLPLDPLHPTERHYQVLEQSRPRLVLATEAFVPTLTQVMAKLLPESRPAILTFAELDRRAASSEPLPVRCAPTHLAYVIYTSGSTGVPKGAMVEHIGMLNHLQAKIGDLQLTSADRIAQTASQCFDISVWQFLAALLVGGQVHIFEDNIAHDSARLIEQARREHISILETVPVLLRGMLDEVERVGTARAGLPALRWIIATGEALPPDLRRRWLECYPQIPILNAYGPTECSDDVTHHPIATPPAPDVMNMPIGRPID